ncbi:MAG: aminotransferase class I/II-fold pyridoxal phosphate-dependent enzyme, partial [Clostridia bacterium]|nr:aminotransferase class I/II-fold pyridoxal phosphate-dependent enzyme [Clostridia bacterium]
MQFDQAYFDRQIDRRGTDCEKWDDRGILNEDGIPLWVADMDFPCAPAITAAIRKRAEHPCFGYNCENPDNEGALRAFWLRRHGLDIQEGQSIMLPCVITGLKTCVRAFTKEGDGVIIFTPVYGPFYESIRVNNRKIIPIPLQADGQGVYRMGMEAIEEALKGGAKLIMVCNPHNPVSRLWTREELTELVQMAARYDAKIVSDVIHADFFYAPGAFTPILTIVNAAERTV